MRSDVGKDLHTRAFGWLLDKTVLVSGVLAIAMGFVAFWGFHRTKSEPSAPINTEPAVQQGSASIVGDDHVNKEQTTAKQPRPRKKVSRFQAKVQLPPAKISVAAVPVTATLQIEIEHHFTNALASVWLDMVLVYTQPLQGEKTRRALLFQKVVGHQFEAIRVPMVDTKVRVRIQSASESHDQSKTIADVLVRNESTLRVVCGNTRSELQLTLQ